MKLILTLFLFLNFLISQTALANYLADCPRGQERAFNSVGSYVCRPIVISECWNCQYQRNLNTNQYPTMPLYPTQNQLPWWPAMGMPWWASYGQTYPNFHYPGPWINHGMNGDYFPGNGHLYAAKPNIYVENKSSKLHKFSLKLLLNDGQQILTTSPALSDNVWEGIITTKNFRVHNVGYPYLFYDVRMQHTDFQYLSGWCSPIQELVSSMVKDLEKLKFPDQSKIDFEEHWTQKIPTDYESYCVYPQYNNKLDEKLKIEMSPKAPFVRALYIVVPQLSEQTNQKNKIKPPRTSHLKHHPRVSVEKLMFFEWGVAFLDHSQI